MLAAIQALEDWHHFLEGAHHEVEIWMDHKNLEYFMSAKKLNRRQARWSLTCPGLISPCIANQDILWASPMLYLVGRTMAPEQETTAMSRCSAWSSSQH